MCTNKSYCAIFGKKLSKPCGDSHYQSADHQDSDSRSSDYRKKSVLQGFAFGKFKMYRMTSRGLKANFIQSVSYKVLRNYVFEA